MDDILFKHGDFLTFTLVDVGTFHVKRFDVRTGVPPLTDGEGKSVFIFLVRFIHCHRKHICRIHLVCPYIEYIL